MSLDAKSRDVVAWLKSSRDISVTALPNGKFQSVDNDRFGGSTNLLVHKSFGAMVDYFLSHLYGEKEVLHRWWNK